MEDQLTALQMRIAYQDRTIEALDEVVREFTARIERLEARVDALQDKLRQGQTEIGPHDEAPPHY